MKKQIFIAAFGLCAAFGYSQGTPIQVESSNSSIWPSSGKVGIGTNSPAFKLQVLSNTLSSISLGGNYSETIASIGRFSTSSLHFETSGYTPSLRPGTGTTFHVHKLQMYDQSVKVGFLEFNGQPTTNTSIAAVSIGTNGIESMRINQNGKVRIATTDIKTPDGYKLFVEDGILTEKVKVSVKTTANWADYVFATDYKLMPLNEVEKFTKENNHLPNVPSASEMVNNGLDVAQMDAKLMEKVEELTLYLIEQNKQIELLKAEVKTLKEQKQ